MNLPICMAEDYWKCSQFSIARHYGCCRINGVEFVIVNKFGITVFELSNPKSKHFVGEGQMAIPPGEPCDLIQEPWIPIYKKLGRDNFITLLQDNPGITLKEAKAKIKNIKKC